MAQRVQKEPLNLDFANGAKISLSGASQQTAAFNGAGALWIVTDTLCYFRTGSNPTAAADGTSAALPPGLGLIVRINPGDKLAAIGSSGNLVATPVL